MPEQRLVYLIDLKPTTATTDYLPAGRKWKQRNGKVTLMTSPARDGRVYGKSLHTQANSEIVHR